MASNDDFIALMEGRLNGSTAFFKSKLRMLQDAADRRLPLTDNLIKDAQNEIALLERLSESFGCVSREASEELHLVQCLPNRIRNSRALINRVPNEVLIQILSLAAFGDAERPSPFYLFPFIATCHRWRDVVLAAPHLWSVLVYDYDPEAVDVRSPRTLLESTAEFLRRSKLAPIDIFIYHHGTSLRPFEKLSQILFPHMPRCKSFAFVGHPECLRLFLPIKETSSLLNLHLWVSTSRSDGPVVFFNPGFASHLKRLAVRIDKENDDEALPNPFDISTIDGSHITSLEFSGHELFTTDMMSLAARCPLLTDIDMHCTRGEADSISTSLPKITLPKLQFLVQNEGPRLWPCISSRSLRHMYMYLSPENLDEFNNACAGPLDIPYPNLRSLQLLRGGRRTGRVNRVLRIDSIIREHRNLVVLGLPMSPDSSNEFQNLTRHLEAWAQFGREGDGRKRYIRILPDVGVYNMRSAYPLFMLLQLTESLHLQIIDDTDLFTMVQDRYPDRVEIRPWFPQSIRELADSIDPSDL